MPLPSHSLILSGGCNCRAIRYKVAVPPVKDRPISPYRNPGADIGQDARIPAVYIDHCNDCRRATSGVLPVFLVTEMRSVSISCLPKELITPTGKTEIDDSIRQWPSFRSATQDNVGPTAEGTTLGLYISLQAATAGSAHIVVRLWGTTSPMTRFQKSGGGRRCSTYWLEPLIALT